ncbi:MAG: cupin domain-containing protein [Ruminococcaceae bacterium]|nr:cupin domain-containing protein [Oscillospiraceae bacterium]
MAILNNESGKYAANFVQVSPGPGMDPEFKAIYDKFAKRIIWMDGEVCPGAFQMNTAWYSAVPERDPIFTEHVHDDCDELIGFFSSDPDNPYDLGGEIEYTVGGEAHLLTKSTMIFVPANLPHNPMRILRVDRPIFHFSVVTKTKYEAESVYK